MLCDCAVLTPTSSESSQFGFASPMAGQRMLKLLTLFCGEGFRKQDREIFESESESKNERRFESNVIQL